MTGVATVISANEIHVIMKLLIEVLKYCCRLTCFIPCDRVVMHDWKVLHVIPVNGKTTVIYGEFSFL